MVCAIFSSQNSFSCWLSPPIKVFNISENLVIDLLEATLCLAILRSVLPSSSFSASISSLSSQIRSCSALSLLQSCSFSLSDWLCVCTPQCITALITGFCLLAYDLGILILSNWEPLLLLMFSLRGTEKWRVSRKVLFPLGLSFSYRLKFSSGKACSWLRSGFAFSCPLVPCSLMRFRQSSIPTSLFCSMCANRSTRLLNSCAMLATSMVCGESGARRAAWARQALMSRSPSVSSHLSSSTQIEKWCSSLYILFTRRFLSTVAVCTSSPALEHFWRLFWICARLSPRQRLAGTARWAGVESMDFLPRFLLSWRDSLRLRRSNSAGSAKWEKWCCWVRARVLPREAELLSFRLSLSSIQIQLQQYKGTISWTSRLPSA